MFKIVVILHLLKFIYQTNVTVTIENTPFTDCNGTYWTTVDFFFDKQKITKPLNEVCGKGKKSFTAVIAHTDSVINGNMGIRLNEAITSTKPGNNAIWFVQKITVTSSEFETEIGIGRILDAGRVHQIRNFDAIVDFPSEMEDQRIQDMALERILYDKSPLFGKGPLLVKGLNKETLFDIKVHLATKRKYLSHAFLTTKKVLIQDQKEKKFSSLREIELFWKNSALPSQMQTPKIHEYWREDKWFAAMRLQGVNPHLITRINDIPIRFKYDKEKLIHLIGSIEDALHNEKLFLVHVDSMEHHDKLGAWSPMALFHIDRNDTLMPVAIQLRKRDNKDDVFYREDSYAWMLAKMYFNSMDFVDSQIRSHLAHAHFLMDNIGVAVHRYLPPNHPIHKLLKPHFYATFGINVLGAHVLLSPRGFVKTYVQGGLSLSMKIISEAMNNLDYNVINPILNVERRNVENIKVYPARDRGIDIYGAIKEYVSGIVGNYYPSSKEVRNDDFLRKFRINLALRTEYHGVGWKNLPGSDSGQMSKKNLMDLLATIIYQATAGHAVVGDLLFDQMSLPMNAPAKPKKSPPSAKDSDLINEKYILDCLPDKEETVNTSLMFKTLSTSFGNPLGNPGKRLLFSPCDEREVQTLLTQLDKLKEKHYRSIDDRYEYDYLNIDNIRNSIRA